MNLNDITNKERIIFILLLTALAVLSREDIWAYIVSKFNP